MKKIILGIFPALVMMLCVHTTRAGRFQAKDGNSFREIPEIGVRTRVHKTASPGADIEMVEELEKLIDGV